MATPLQQGSRDILVHEILGGSPSGSTPGFASAAEAAPQSPDEPATLQEIIALQERFNSDPLGVTREMQEVVDPNLTPEQLGRALQESRNYFESPDTAVAFVRAEHAHFAAAQPLPGDFVQRYIHPKYQAANIPIDPYEHRFEDDHPTGLVGWIVWNGIPALRRLFAKERLRSHLQHPSRFTYDLSPPPNETLRVALFADFGTGLAHSQFIAHQFGVENYDAVVHLGDVYYTGTKAQYREYFERPLARTLENRRTKIFLLPDNHESYSGFSGFFDYVARQRSQHPGTQVQEGSYFCLRTPHAQFLGLDTVWHKRGRYPNKALRTWLRDHLERGRDQGKANVLLTGYHAYEYGNKKRSKILSNDLKDMAIRDNLVDLWFWGNTHYCALFGRSEKTPFIGSCIGHGGYPYALLEPSHTHPTDVVWLEQEPRYGDTGVRSDRGNNGYCLVEITAQGAISLRYIDWRGNDRKVVPLQRRPGERHLSL